MSVKLVLFLIPWVILGRQLLDDGGPQIPTQAYYTIDDGQTWFADDINKLSPFDKDGKPAYRVYVFTCDGGRTQFASYLERYTPEAHRKLEAARAQGADADPAIYEEVYLTGMEVKKPGAGQWVKLSDWERSTAISSPICPDGTLNNIEPTYP